MDLYDLCIRKWIYLVGSLEDESNMRKHTTPTGEVIEKGVVMARISTRDFGALQWDEMQYWCGDQWKVHSNVDSVTVPALAPVLYHTGGGETTLQFNEKLGLWYMIFVQQANNNKFMLHYSEAVEGPWNAVELYQPPAPFTDIEHWVCYAVKAHPGLAQDDEIVFSHICTQRPWKWPGMTNVYVPQFVRVKVSKVKSSLSVKTVEPRAPGNLHEVSAIEPLLEHSITPTQSIQKGVRKARQPSK